jgi:hypothetical protein
LVRLTQGLSLVTTVLRHRLQFQELELSRGQTGENPPCKRE